MVLGCTRIAPSEQIVVYQTMVIGVTLSGSGYLQSESAGRGLMIE